MYTSKAYRSSPVWVQEAMLSARFLVRRLLREGRALAPELQEVEKTQWLDQAALEMLQLERFRANVDHAAKHVPFYRELYAKHGVTANDIRSLADVAKVPIIDKPDVQAAGRSMLSEVKTGPRFETTSSGTTGAHVVAWRDLRSIVRENAFLARQLAWAGVKYGDRRVWLRGDKIVPATDTNGPFWRRNYADNSLMMSVYHLSEERITTYLIAMQDFDPVVIQAYPAAVVYLASLLDATGQKYSGRSLKAIVTSSEMITESQRRICQRVFGCPVYDWYGNFERVGAIGTCEKLRYHLISDYALCELHPVEGAACELVGTSFDNAAMPWIRYRVHDLVTPEPAGRTCECGRAFPLIRSIEGRDQDYLVAPGDKRVFMPVNAFDYIDGLLEGQFIQNEVDRVTVLCKLAPNSPSTLESIEQHVRNHTGGLLQVDVKLVDEIPRTASGKLRPVVRTVNR